MEGNWRGALGPGETAAALHSQPVDTAAAPTHTPSTTRVHTQKGCLVSWRPLFMTQNEWEVDMPDKESGMDEAKKPVE